MAREPTLQMFRDLVILEQRSQRVVWLLGGGLRTVAEPREITKELLVLCEEVVDKVTMWPRPELPDGLRPQAEQIVKTLRPIMESSGGSFNDPHDRRVWMTVGSLQTTPNDLAVRIQVRRQQVEQLLQEELENARSAKDAGCEEPA